MVMSKEFAMFKTTSRLLLLRFSYNASKYRLLAKSISVPSIVFLIDSDQIA
jgi:hypothetical protein